MKTLNALLVVLSVVSSSTAATLTITDVVKPSLTSVAVTLSGPTNTEVFVWGWSRPTSGSSGAWTQYSTGGYATNTGGNSWSFTNTSDGSITLDVNGHGIWGTATAAGSNTVFRAKSAGGLESANGFGWNLVSISTNWSTLNNPYSSWSPTNLAIFTTNGPAALADGTVCYQWDSNAGGWNTASLGLFDPGIWEDPFIASPGEACIVYSPSNQSNIIIKGSLTGISTTISSNKLALVGPLGLDGEGSVAFTHTFTSLRFGSPASVNGAIIGTVNNSDGSMTTNFVASSGNITSSFLKGFWIKAPATNQSRSFTPVIW